MSKGTKKITNPPADTIIMTYSDKPAKRKTPVVGKSQALDGVKKTTIPMWDMPKGGRNY